MNDVRKPFWIHILGWDGQALLEKHGNVNSEMPFSQGRPTEKVPTSDPNVDGRGRTLETNNEPHESQATDACVTAQLTRVHPGPRRTSQGQPRARG